MRPTIIAILLPTLLLISQLGFGEEVYRTDEVLVEDSREDLSYEKPSAFTTVIYPETYADQLLTLPEILSQQVGIFVKGFGGLGQLSTVSIRGSTAEQVSVFIDGIKINTASGGAVDFSTLPLGGIERIEVIRGGAGSRFGSDAIGGVINIVTKKSKKELDLELKFSAGSFLTLETREGFSKNFGPVGLTFNHTHLSSNGDFPFLSTGVTLPDGTDLGGGEEFLRLHNGFFSEGVLTRLDSPVGENRRLSFLNDFFYSSRDEPGPEIETTVLYPDNPLNAHRNEVRNTTGVQFHWDDVAVPGLSFSFIPNYDYQTSHFTDPTPALGGPINITSENQAVGAKPQFVYEWVQPGITNLFTLFYDFRYNYFNDRSPLPGADLAGQHTRRTHALFFQDEISLLQDRLYFNPSARWENANDFGSDYALHFGIVGKPTRWVTLKANVENSFRYPTFDELYFPDQGFIRGNPDLKEEKSFNFDVGARFHWNQAALEVAYFQNHIDNSIIFVPISAFTIAPLNTGPAEERGFEVTLFLKPVSSLEINGNYTFLAAHFDNSSKQLPGRPRHLANASIRWEYKSFSLFSRMQYIDKLPLDFENTKFIRSRVLVDVGGTYEWNNHFFVTLEGKNVGNVQTSDSLGFPLPRAQIYASLGYKS